MRKTFWYLVGGQLAVISIPAFAQSEDIDPAHTASPPEVAQPAAEPQSPGDEMAAMEGWPEERRATYQSWPPDAQAYFWTLTPERQELFFLLRDTDRLAVVAMDEPGRAEAWRMIEERAAQPAEPEDSPDAAPQGDEPMGRS